MTAARPRKWAVRLAPLVITAAVLVLAYQCSGRVDAAELDEEKVQVSILAGGLVSASSQAEAALAPTARIQVAMPLADWGKPPRLHVQADLSALPGESLDLEDPTTFRSLEFRVGVSQRLHDSFYADLYAELGFATRLPGDPRPRDTAVRWGAGGVRIGRFGRGWLALLVGGDQRLDGLYRPVALVSGALTLYRAEDGALKGSGVQLVGEAILALDLYGASTPRRDSIRVGMAVGR